MNTGSFDMNYYQTPYGFFFLILFIFFKGLKFICKLKFKKGKFFKRRSFSKAINLPLIGFYPYVNIPLCDYNNLYENLL